jgi:peptidoglycan-associated lipoprotein
MRLRLAHVLSVVAVAFTGVSPLASRAETDRYLVFFEEWSARLSPDAKQVIAEATAKAKEAGTRTIRIEGRASAVGFPETNKRMAETRTSIVADELTQDGIAAANIRQVPIGQTGSGDPGVTDRRVDIILEP